jgi:mono/diheme cytochrome c family protein
MYTSMKKIFVMLCLASFIIACGGGANTDEAQATSTAAAEKPAIDGQKIYKQYCVTCHGLYGDMGASGAFNLQTSELSVEERVNVITNGRNVMTGFKTLLSEDKIVAVAKYTLELKQ